MHFLCLLSMRARGYITCIEQCKLIIVIPTHVQEEEEEEEDAMQHAPLLPSHRTVRSAREPICQLESEEAVVQLSSDGCNGGCLLCLLRIILVIFVESSHCSISILCK